MRSVRVLPSTRSSETFSADPVSLEQIETSPNLEWMRTWGTTGLLTWEDKNGDGLIQYYNDKAPADSEIMQLAEENG